jgi:hypothetical protein
MRSVEGVHAQLLLAGDAVGLCVFGTCILNEGCPSFEEVIHDDNWAVVSS